MTVPRQCRLGRVTGIILALFASPSYSFTKPFNNFATISHSQRKSVGGRSFTSNYLTTKDEGDNLHLSPSQFSLSTTVTKKLVHSVALVSAILSLVLTTVPNAALADEYGVETEAPTLFTGESIMICVKRGPLGACQKTEERTPANDNDKAAKYFLEPGKKVVDKDLAMRRSSDGNMESELVTRLKQQTSDNKERNDQIVKMKSLENDQSANFGPFDRQVVILNADGNSFTLLQNPQAMRLKKMGYIKDRRFVTQPSKEVIDAALEAEDSGFGEVFKEIFGSK